MVSVAEINVDVTVGDEVVGVGWVVDGAEVVLAVDDGAKVGSSTSRQPVTRTFLPAGVVPVQRRTGKIFTR